MQDFVHQQYFHGDTLKSKRFAPAKPLQKKTNLPSSNPYVSGGELLVFVWGVLSPQNFSDLIQLADFLFPPKKSQVLYGFNVEGQDMAKKVWKTCNPRIVGLIPFLGHTWILRAKI